MNLDKKITSVILMTICGVLISFTINIATTLDAKAQKRKLFAHNHTVISSKDRKFFVALSERESSNNPKAQNRFGYIGKYQFGEEALAVTGYYIKDKTRKNDWIGKWTGKNGIYSKNDYLNNPKVQDKAAAELASKNWHFARQKGLHKYVGTKVSGIYITKSGIVASMHLLGPQKVSDFLKHGKANSDGFGTSVKDYMHKFSNHDLTTAFA